MKQGERVAWALCALLAAGGGFAQQPEAPEAAPAEAHAPEALPPGVTPGPSRIDLGHDVTLEVGEPYMFVEKELAAGMLEQGGSFHHENLLGVVVPKSEANWFVVVRWDDEGYVKEDEEIDADDLLKTIRKGVRQQNEERKDKGFAPIQVAGWAEPPHYDVSRHHLVWGLDVTGGEGAGEGVVVNYNTRALGRKGVLSMNLVTDKSTLQADKAHAAALLASTTFADGSRYEDYQEGDKVAEYGIAGLVLAGAGLAAIKIAKGGFLLAFLKPILAGLLAAKKALIALVVGGAALARRIFGGRSNAAPPSGPPPLPPTA